MSQESALVINTPAPSYTTEDSDQKPCAIEHLYELPYLWTRKVSPSETVPFPSLLEGGEVGLDHTPHNSDDLSHQSIHYYFSVQLHHELKI